MPSPTLALSEALWLLDETAHQLTGYIEDRDEPWVPLEDMLRELSVFRWLLEREKEDAERPGPPVLKPAGG